MLGVIVAVLVTCLVAVSKYLGNKGKEGFAVVYSFPVYSSLCREIRMKDCLRESALRKHRAGYQRLVCFLFSIRFRTPSHRMVLPSVRVDRFSCAI